MKWVIAVVLSIAAIYWFGSSPNHHDGPLGIVATVFIWCVTLLLYCGERR